MRRGPKSGSRFRAVTFEAEALACLDSLYRTAVRVTRASAEAEDLVQETYLKAFRAAERFQPETNLKALIARQPRVEVKRLASFFQTALR